MNCVAISLLGLYHTAEGWRMKSDFPSEKPWPCGGSFQGLPYSIRPFILPLGLPFHPASSSITSSCTLILATPKDLKFTNNSGYSLSSLFALIHAIGSFPLYQANTYVYFKTQLEFWFHSRIPGCISGVMAESSKSLLALLHSVIHYPPKLLEILLPSSIPPLSSQYDLRVSFPTFLFSFPFWVFPS